jgi:uridine kinase
MTNPKPTSTALLVAIVGGSGSGKTWLAEKLQAALPGKTARLSLDDFYRDRSHLSAARRAKLNFDHPRAIDWAAVERVLRDLLAGRPARVPCYDFKTHCRLRRSRILGPRPIILMDGLWLLRRPALRRLFALRIFLDCPAHTRLQRRLSRDLLSRGRTRASVEEQFRTSVEPMHVKYVAPQSRRADVVLRQGFGPPEIEKLAAQLRAQFASPPRPGRILSQNDVERISRRGRKGREGTD